MCALATWHGRKKAGMAIMRHGMVKKAAAWHGRGSGWHGWLAGWICVCDRQCVWPVWHSVAIVCIGMTVPWPLA